MRKGKTREVKVIQSHFGTRWDDEAVYEKEEYGQIKEDLYEYRMSSNLDWGLYRVITRRIKNDETC